jgi:subtilisin family serine protease
MSCITSRRGLTCAAFLFLVLIFPGKATGMFKEGFTPPPPKVISDELIVRFKPNTVSAESQMMNVSSIGANGSALRSLMSKYGVSKIEPMSPRKTPTLTSIAAADTSAPSGVCRLTLSRTNGADIRDIAREFSSDPSVAYAEPNYIFQICVSPNDPYFEKQWGLAKVGAVMGWDSKVGDPKIVIAVVDTGVDYNHKDLAANIWTNTKEVPNNGIDDDGNGYIDDIRGWDFVSVPSDWVWPGEDPGPEDNNPMDFVGHGTHVSGIASGITNNNLGTAGMAWDCRIMPLRAGYAASDGYGYLEYFDAGRAIRYAADNGADIINMSWGGLEDSEFIRESLEYAYSKGCVLVAAAGNVTSDYASLPYYPAAYPEVLAVAATDQDDLLSVWNWYVFSNYGSWVDVCAPGTYVLSTLPGNSYGYYSGTSMASPHVAGLAALVKSKYPKFTNEQIMQRIKSTASNVDTINPSFLAGLIGGGRIDAHKALGNILISIDYPKNGSTIFNKVAIKGSADIENFKSYRLEYGVGKNPNIWTMIGKEHTRPNVSEILENWDAKDLFGEYTVRLTLVDSSDEKYVSETTVNISSAADVELMKGPLPAPNPFNPKVQDGIKIYYELGSVPSGGADIDVIVYDITGTPVWRVKKHSASPGPVDDLYWDGVSAFGEKVSNGVYPFFLVCDGKIIGRSKIAVFR